MSYHAAEMRHKCQSVGALFAYASNKYTVNSDMSWAEVTQKAKCRWQEIWTFKYQVRRRSIQWLCFGTKTKWEASICLHELHFMFHTLHQRVCPQACVCLQIWGLWSFYVTRWKYKRGTCNQDLDVVYLRDCLSLYSIDMFSSVACLFLCHLSRQQNTPMLFGPYPEPTPNTWPPSNPFCVVWRLKLTLCSDLPHSQVSKFRLLGVDAGLDPIHCPIHLVL